MLGIRTETPGQCHENRHAQYRADHTFPGLSGADAGGKLGFPEFPPGEISRNISHPDQAHHGKQPQRMILAQIHHRQPGRYQHRPSNQRHQQWILDLPACHQPSRYDRQPKRG